MCWVTGEKTYSFNRQPLAIPINFLDDYSRAKNFVYYKVAWDRSLVIKK